MKKLTGLLLVMFAILIYSSVWAEDPRKSDFHFDSTLKTKVFLTDGPVFGLSKPSKDEIRKLRITSFNAQDNALDALWGIDLDLALRHPYFTLNTLIITKGEKATPGTIGLRGEVLLPVSKLWSDSDYLKIGGYHHSDHDLEGDVMTTLDANALVAKLRLFRDEGFELWAQAYWHGLGGVGEPAHFVTQDAEISLKEIKTFKPQTLLWDAGLQARWLHRWFDARVGVGVRTSEDGLAALPVKGELMVPLSRIVGNTEFTDRVSLGVFGQYNRNLSETDTFGKDEFVGGVQLNFSFTSPSPEMKSGSDLF